MTKAYYFKLTEAVYDGCNNLRVAFNFKKSTGYVANIAAVQRSEYSFSTVLSAGYFKYKPIDILIVPATRRSAKKENAALEVFSRNARVYAEEFIKT